ncbi:MAG: hypothetical protein COU27_02000 [Candidatus Levybacteria bacterium CG10_big_fil_rev_8_21_14_0_10_36_7]|nr:MAG: hypothetical protein COU27_02000 [Candidatus Levybacteria bacterium CG10_big_fil_rev_8_21_14_0_10_36_7]
MELDISKISKIAEVSHLNFLFGAGVSAPFIDPLPDIEKQMDQTEEQGRKEEAIKLKKEFFSKVMSPCLNIKSYSYVQDKEDETQNTLTQTYENYKSFLIATTKYLLSRKSTLLDKQVNLFTTNIDIFLEKILEDAGANYNDGFIGHMNPSFRTSHFQTIIKKKSEYLERQSEVPTFNLYKLHGSLTWRLDEDTKNITYSNLSSLSEVNELENDEFNSAYTKLQIINPNRKKFATSVLESTYYEIFRLYATELEKENALLIVAGFSFGDDHILQVTRRAMDSNPTLTVCILCHSKEREEDYKKKFEGVRYANNLYIIVPTSDEKIDLKWAVENLISRLDQNSDVKNHADQS